MSREVKIIIAVVLIIIVIICCFTLGKKDNKNENEVTNEIVNEIENEVSNEITNNVENEVETNTAVENKVEEVVIENVIEVEPQGTIYETNSDIGTTDKKQEAINLVKEKWGEDDTVTFRCDSVTSGGEYIIAVVSKETATVKNYFKVNLATKSVEVDY